MRCGVCQDGADLFGDMTSPVSDITFYYVMFPKRENPKKAEEDTTSICIFLLFKIVFVLK